MRYILEATTKKAEKELEKFLRKESGFEIVDTYNPVEKISKQVEKIGVALRQLRKSGIDDEILQFYLRGKGIPSITINNVLHHLRNFFKKAGLLSDEDED